MIGPCRPGDAMTLCDGPGVVNSQGSLSCGQATIQTGYPGANDLTVNWTFTFKGPLAGFKNVYLYADDRFGLNSGIPDVRNLTVEFADVPSSHGFYSFIMDMSDEYTMSVCFDEGEYLSGTTFCPDNNVTRAAVAKYIIKAKHRIRKFAGDIDAVKGLSGYSDSQYFTDVSPGSSFPYVPRHPQYEYIQMMKVDGITGGCGGGFYCPDTIVTRGIMAVLLIRAIGEAPSTVAYNAYFDDLTSPVDYTWAAGYINRIKELGITSGCGYRFAVRIPT